MDTQRCFPQINYTICIGCGDCIRLCPTNTFRVQNGYPIVYDPVACNYCGLCESICSATAIALPYWICRADENSGNDTREQPTLNENPNSSSYIFLENLPGLIKEIPADSIVSRTFYKDDHLNAVLFGFAVGQALSEHTAAQPATIHILSGKALVTLGDETFQMDSGAWIHMPPHMKHSIMAQSQLIMLLLLFK